MDRYVRFFRDTTIIAHKTAVFNCTAIVGIPPGQSVWTINGKVVSNSDTAVHTLTKSFDRYDQGAILNCGIIHQTLAQPEETGLTCEQPITMDIQFPPIVNITNETEGTVVEGEDYFAKGEVQERGNPDIVDKWYWVFPDETKHNNGTLYLKDVTREANGTYTCVAENTYYDGSTGYGNATVDLNVHYEPLAVIKDDSNGTVIEGQTYKAYCGADANPAVELYWTDPKDDRIAIGDILEIIDTKREDVGNYTCHATNVLFTGRAGYANATVHLDVQYPPTLEVESEYVCKEEESVTLLCELKDANPLKVDFVWLLENGSMVSSASVTLTEVSRVDAGQYVCNGYNIYYDGEHGHGSVTTILDVQYRPEVFTQTVLIRVAEGAPVTLDCTTDSNPPTDSHDWTLNGDVISYELIHTIDRADRSDAGLYTCTAVNTFYDGEKGMGYNTTQLVVECKYTKYNQPKDETIEVAIGSSVSLHCNVDAYPIAEITWAKNGVKLDTGDNFSKLLISNVDASHGGGYLCTAENYLGVDEHKIQLNVNEQERQSSVVGPVVSTVVAIVCVVAVAVASVFVIKRRKKMTSDRPSVYTSLETYAALSNSKSDSDIVYAKPGDIVLEFPKEYVRPKDVIGEGTFGRVAKAEAWELAGSEGVNIVALKTVKDNASQDDKKRLIDELELLKTIGQHKHVLSLIGCCTKTEPVYLLFEYMALGDLQKYLRESRKANTDNYANARTRSASLTSSDLCIHGDLAARNVLLNADKICKVTNFGRDLDNLRGSGDDKKTRLPVRWMAPEALWSSEISTKSDVWSFGVVVWEIVTLGRLKQKHSPSTKEIEGL
ncbi:fibroblast growth factor receptor 2-like [Ptychodera flava]|uniref:fibroblast growth factor receptor 2-like n=1 Tax=Ptychodera flava TaxID=63121 RepID=UPI003969C295